MRLVLLSVLAITLGCGKDGANGTQGSTGPSGKDGTVITVIQFCPGITTYPGTFVETGFCIDNKIYAVYSKNDGFLTEVVPGRYSSNAINSSCSFTVLPNCVVQN